MAQLLARAGATVEEIGLPTSFATCYAAHRTVMHTESAAFHEQNFRDRADDYGPMIRGAIEAGMLIPGVRYLQLNACAGASGTRWPPPAGRVDALLTPSTPAPAPRDLTTTGDSRFQSPWTSSGLPTLTIPSGLSASGLPLGIQLAGPPFGEARLLAVGRWCEAALDVNLAPPGLD